MESAKLNFAFFGVLVALGLLAVAILQPPQAASPELVTHVNGLTHTVQELRTQHGKLIRSPIVDLPEDGAKWYTLLIYKDKSLLDPADRRLAAMMNSTPRLQSLMAQTKVMGWDAKDPLYGAGYAKHFGG